MSRAGILEPTETSDATVALTDAEHRARATKAVSLFPALAAEVCRLDEEGRELQIRASRLARDTRPEFEAWFEAGLLLRRAGERLADLVRRLDPPGQVDHSREPA